MVSHPNLPLTSCVYDEIIVSKTVTLSKISEEFVEAPYRK